MPPKKRLLKANDNVGGIGDNVYVDVAAVRIGADGEGEETVFAEDENIPIWARQGVSAMRSLGVFDAEDSERSADCVTRADAAEYLYRIICVCISVSLFVFSRRYKQCSCIILC